RTTAQSHQRRVPDRVENRSRELTLHRHILSGATRALEPVQDQTESEFELARAVVTRGCEVLLRVLGEVGKVAGSQLLQDGGREVCKVSVSADSLRAGRMAELPHRESQNVTVERVVRVIGQLRREAGFTKSCEQPFHVSQS